MVVAAVALAPAPVLAGLQCWVELAPQIAAELLLLMLWADQVAAQAQV